jgi:hypothetical protein
MEETVNDDSHGAFNLVAISAALPVPACPGRIRFRFWRSKVAGFGSRGGCYDPAAVTCNACAPPSYCTSTTLADAEASHLMVEEPCQKRNMLKFYYVLNCLDLS